MEGSLIPEAKAVSNKRTLAGDPQYIGAYLNMARHNVFLISNHIVQKFPDLGFARLTDDEKICMGENILLHIFDENYPKHVEYRDGVFHYLKRFLPAIKIFNPEDAPRPKPSGNIPLPPLPLANIDYKGLHQFLRISFEELEALRNAYTHYYAFDVASGEDVERKQNLDVNLQKNVQYLFEKAPLYALCNFDTTHKKEDFHHLDQYRLFEGEGNKLTPEGLFFFICLFLERGYAFKFLKRFSGYKNENTGFFKATLKVFTTYTLKLPHEKLLSGDPKQALLLDMLNELGKCPKELYSRLKPEHQDLFKPQLDEAAQKNVMLNSITGYIEENELDLFLKDFSTRKRREDRFPYFALRFLDLTNALPNTYFQVRLGKLLLKKYIKPVAGIDVDRKIHKEVNAFGKLDELNNEEKILGQLKQGKENHVYFEQFAPHYHISNNKIGIYLAEPNQRVSFPLLTEKEKIIQAIPQAFLSIHELPKIVLLDWLKKGEPERMVLNYIKTLTNSMYDYSKLEALRDKLEYDPETFTRRLDGQLKLYKKRFLKGFEKKKLNEENKKRAEYRDFLKARRILLDQALQEKYGNKIQASQLSEKLLDYLMKIEPADLNKHIQHRIKSIRTETQKRKRAYDKKPQLKTGEIATYIARDFLNMVADEKIKEGITSVYYTQLQNKLAYFSQAKEVLLTLCEECKLFTAREGHVFLTRDLIRNSRTITDMYGNYLDAKMKWIETVLMKTEHRKTVFYIPTDRPVPYTLKKYGITTYDFKEWLMQKAVKPVDLPTDLFDDRIAELMKERLKQNGIATEDKERFALLLNKYLRDDTQPFYNYERIYCCADGEKRTIAAQGKTSKELKQYGKQVEENEKKIRFVQTKDRLMRLMIESLMQSEPSLQLQEAITLQRIYPGSPDSPLESPAVFKQSVEYKIAEPGAEKNISKTKTIIAQNTKKSLEEIKEAAGMPGAERKGYRWTAKDYGTFRRFVYDRRLSYLLEYFEGDEIPFSVLEWELKEYDKYREEIFDRVFELEKIIVAAGKERLKTLAENRKYHEVQFDVYMSWIREKMTGYDNLDLIQQVRNRFSHSEFPPPGITGVGLISKEKQEEFDNHHHEKEYIAYNYNSVSKQVYAKFNEEITRLMQKIA